jgi:predicted MFS family arabinose efflux permease
VLGGVASLAGTSWTFGAIGVASLGLVAWAATTPSHRPDAAQPLRLLALAFGSPRFLGAFWFVLLPALLFGTVSVLAPLRLAVLGFGSVAIGAVFFVTGALEAVLSIVLGRLTDRRGAYYPIAIGLAASIVVAALYPWPSESYVLAAVVVCGGLAFGTLFTPGMTLVTNRSEERGLSHGYTFALVNLAWAPGQALGSAGGGALAHATSDAVPYLALSAVCACSLAVVWRVRAAG